MKAILLSAGRGSRLRPITDNCPKTLVKVAGKPILHHQLRSLYQNHIKDIVVVTGYLGDQIEKFRKESRFDFEIIHNPDWDTTNNLYSLYLAKDHIRGWVRVLNGDVCINTMTLFNTLNKTTGVLVDTDTYDEESMKVTFDEEDERITKISKDIPKEESLGCSLDVYLFNPVDSEKLRQQLVYSIEEQNLKNQWTEVLLDRLFKETIKAKPIYNASDWVEIDTEEDLNEAEKTFNFMIQDLPKKEIFFFDKDGTLSIENKTIDGAKDVLEKYNSYVLTNNTSKTPQEHQKDLKELGNPKVISPLIGLCDFLTEQNMDKVFISATNSVKEYIEKNSNVHHEENTPEALVLTYNTEIDYSEIELISKLLMNNIPYFATHSDMLCPIQDGFIPDIGSFIDMFEVATKRKPNKVFGKPNASMVESTLKTNNVSPKDAVIVGDRLYTDIVLGKNTGMTTILVCSGETKRNHLQNSSVCPDIVLSSIKDLL